MMEGLKENFDNIGSVKSNATSDNIRKSEPIDFNNNLFSNFSDIQSEEYFYDDIEERTIDTKTEFSICNPVSIYDYLQYPCIQFTESQVSYPKYLSLEDKSGNVNQI